MRDAIFKYSDPVSIDMQLEALKASGADVFINLAIGRSATRAISKAYDSDWHPLQFIPNASLSIAAFLDPAGLDRGHSRDVPGAGAGGCPRSLICKQCSTECDSEDRAVYSFCTGKRPSL